MLDRVGLKGQVLLRSEQKVSTTWFRRWSEESRIWEALVKDSMELIGHREDQTKRLE